MYGAFITPRPCSAEIDPPLSAGSVSQSAAEEKRGGGNEIPRLTDDLVHERLDYLLHRVLVLLPDDVKMYVAIAEVPEARSVELRSMHGKSEKREGRRGRRESDRKCAKTAGSSYARISAIQTAAWTIFGEIRGRAACHGGKRDDSGRTGT
jgi:hypothetical protein